MTPTTPLSVVVNKAGSGAGQIWRSLPRQDCIRLPGPVGEEEEADGAATPAPVHGRVDDGDGRQISDAGRRTDHRGAVGQRHQGISCGGRVRLGGAE